MEDTIRTVKLSPYLKGMGPTFTLRIGDPVYSTGRDKLSYTLTMHDSGESTVIFEGSDFGPSPLHAWDSNDTVYALLGFLTLRPGDTDAEYFEGYTAEQTLFAQEHAEVLSCYVSDRFEPRGGG